MSNEETSSPDDSSERDTLPMGERAPATHVLERIVDTEWERKSEDDQEDGDPSEIFWCRADGCRLECGREGRLWKGHLYPDEGEPRHTRGSEDLGEIARALKGLLELHRESLDQ